MSEVLVEFKQVRFSYHLNPVIEAFDWRWHRGQHWALVGGNASGKTTIARLICDELRPQRGELLRGIDPAQVAHVSFDLQRQLMNHDRRFDDSEVRADAFDVGTTVQRAILGNGNPDREFESLCQRLRIEHILDRGIRYISTGESRKTLIAQALHARPAALILDNPLEGLDQSAQGEMKQILDELIADHTPLLLLLKDIRDVPENIRNILTLDNGEAKPGTEIVLPSAPLAHQTVTPELIRLEGVNVSFHGTTVLRNIHWTLKQGQHAVIRGPNGAGKSTLLGLLCGENDKAYGQKVSLFGRQRGTGESIWEIKARFGLVSTALQLNHIGRLGAAEAVASGLYDSIGLYRDCSGEDRLQVESWMKALGLWELRKTRFHDLSFGQQRLVLLARAMVKWPSILILDEPCIGLDPQQRQHILTIINAIADQGYSHILYVSHTQDEMPACINQALELVPCKDGGHTALVKDIAKPFPDARQAAHTA